MRLTVIGCSGSFPGPDSPASCYLLEADDDTGRPWRVLLDLGNGALGPLQRHVDLRQVDAVLLSHLHPDHCLDLCGLYVARRYHPDPWPDDADGELADGERADDDRRVVVHGPAGTLERLSRGYGAGGGESELAAVMKVEQWRHGEPARVGPFTVTPYEVLHPVEAYGLRVELAGAVLAYTGDSDSCPALVELARDADLLLAEAAFQEGRDAVRGVHLTGLRAGQLATEARARSLVLTHLPVWNDPQVVLAEARQAYAGPIALAAAGQVYPVPSASAQPPA